MSRACLTLLTLLLSSCGGAEFRGSVYRDGGVRYRVGELGPGWQRINIESNNLAFRNEAYHALIQVNGRCDPSMDIPLSSLTGHLLIGFTDRQVTAEQTLPMDGREALRTHVRARLDGVPRELLLYVLKKDGCVYDFAYVAPPGPDFAEGEREFDAFVAGFTTAVSR